MTWLKGVMTTVLGACLGLFSLAGVPRAEAQDISLDGVRPIQAIFEPVPLVRGKRTTMELRITSTFPTDKQIDVRLTKSDGLPILALVTDETGQHVMLTSARTHLTVHPGSGIYYWPPIFATHVAMRIYTVE
jgi:hypothetical protein